MPHRDGQTPELSRGERRRNRVKLEGLKTRESKRKLKKRKRRAMPDVLLGPDDFSLY